MTLDNSLYGNRKPVFKVLVGSHNYNLNTPESDEDYKLFVLPTFDDLYSKTDFTKSIVTDEVDCTIYDIRKLVHLFWASNVNYLEVLYSKKTEILLSNNDTSYDDIIDIFNHREQLCKMNMPYLFSACKGMYYNKLAPMKNANNKDYNEKLGYGPKHAMAAYRILDFLERYKSNLDMAKPNPFENAIYYSDEEKEELLNIRKGIYSFEQIQTILDRKLKQVNESCKKFYTEKMPDEALKDWLTEKLKRIVKDNI